MDAPNPQFLYARGAASSGNRTGPTATAHQSSSDYIHSHPRRSSAPSPPPRGAGADAACRTYTSLVRQYLGLHQIDAATFYAERYHAHTASRPHLRSASLYLLASCHLRSSPRRCRLVLRDGAAEAGRDGGRWTVDDDCRYLLAVACEDWCAVAV
eukprot:CAMPEP_0194320784 /NCGR_PEP_ID=MMETSP0171-20130528/17069_1 /TAXON_ID=218684 /ORGANISM="Corethron pennatum, Strain L29A3" /LENGTH=154 /DNA_ID=CAMNT_0039078445 /DNA_START=45 /DNA_END=506 /DNA_ORIENTATION=-